MNRGSENDKKSNLVIYGVIGVIVIAAVALGLYTLDRSKKLSPISTSTPDAIQSTDSTATISKDSIQQQSPTDSLPHRLPIKWDGENSPWSAYRFIGQAVDLNGRSLRFGDEMWVDEDQSKEAYKVVLGQSSVDRNQPSTFRVNADLLIEKYRFEKYKTNFSLPAFTVLPSGVKKILLDDQYSDGNTYSLTQNEARSRSSIAFGDFDEDGILDVAVMMDNNEKQISRLLIFCSNKATGQPYIAFAENYTDKMRIRAFKEKAKIYMNTSEFVPAPRDGLIVTAEDVVLAIVYDTEAQKFKTYLQE